MLKQFKFNLLIYGLYLDKHSSSTTYIMSTWENTNLSLHIPVNKYVCSRIPKSLFKKSLNKSTVLQVHLKLQIILNKNKMSDHSKIGKDSLVQRDIHILSIMKTG